MFCTRFPLQYSLSINAWCDMSQSLSCLADCCIRCLGAIKQSLQSVGVAAIMMYHAIITTRVEVNRNFNFYHFLDIRLFVQIFLLSWALLLTLWMPSLEQRRVVSPMHQVKNTVTHHCDLSCRHSCQIIFYF